MKPTAMILMFADIDDDDDDDDDDDGGGGGGGYLVLLHFVPCPRREHQAHIIHRIYSKITDKTQSHNIPGPRSPQRSEGQASSHRTPRPGSRTC